jgi:hypothetical protein
MVKSVEQLIAEAKGICASLLIVEAKYIEVANKRALLAQATKCVEADNKQVLHRDYRFPPNHCTKVKFEGACFLMLTASAAADRNQSRMVYELDSITCDLLHRETKNDGPIDLTFEIQNLCKEYHPS